MSTKAREWLARASRDNLVPRGGSALMNELDANLTIWNDGETLELGYNKLRASV